MLKISLVDFKCQGSIISEERLKRMTVSWIYKVEMLEVGLIPFGPGQRSDEEIEWVFQVKRSQMD